MSMKECNECSEKVSSSAYRCPNCGNKLRMNIFGDFILTMIGTFMLLSLIANSCSS